MRPTYTYLERSASAGCQYYAIVTLRSGHTYYIGGFTSRSSAYRAAKKHPEQRG